jgi:hypothetical protein
MSELAQPLDDPIGHSITYRIAVGRAEAVHVADGSTSAHGVFAPHSKLRAAVTPSHRGIGAADRNE